MNSAVLNEPEQTTEELYGISAVSRLTGISPHVLRIWERRYQVVEPVRSDSRRREYSREDVRRLTLVKTLVDHGHSIRHVAGLATEQLEEQVRDVAQLPNSSANAEASPEQSMSHARIAFIGNLVRDPLREAVDAERNLQIVGEFAEIADLRAALKPGAFDLLVIETPTLFEDQVKEIQDLVEEFQARRAILVFRFAQNRIVKPFDKDLRMITAMRAPVNASELRLACVADLRVVPLAENAESAAAARAAIEAGAGLDPEGLPIRQFSDEQLARVARFSSVVQCECPQHLASLLSSLTAFEAYSAQCENRNDEDAKLHAYLHRATADCRAEMEIALRHLMEVEGIVLGD